MTDQNKNTTDVDGLNLAEDEVKPLDDVEKNQDIFPPKSNVEELELDLASDLAEDEIKQIEVKPLNDTEKNQGIFLSKSKIILAKKLLRNIRENNEQLLQLLSDYLPNEEELAIGIGQLGDKKFNFEENEAGDDRVIEGVFDGEHMIGPNGKQYKVPSNYASKSKLVEGDILKLTITGRGNFVYKQIGPIERARIVGILDKDSVGNYFAIADFKKWRLLTASVTYYRGEQGDEIVILIPATGESKWAAVENIVLKTGVDY